MLTVFFVANTKLNENIRTNITKNFFAIIRKTFRGKGGKITKQLRIFLRLSLPTMATMKNNLSADINERYGSILKNSYFRGKCDFPLALFALFGFREFLKSILVNY